MAAAKKFKKDCPRCADGRGNIRAFRHVKGGVCFKCGGAGFVLVLTDPAKLAANAEKRKAAKAAEQADREAAALAAWALLLSKYKDDPRIGPVCRAQCGRSDTYAWEVYKTLDHIDTGIYTHGIESLTNITE